MPGTHYTPSGAWSKDDVERQIRNIEAATDVLRVVLRCLSVILIALVLTFAWSATGKIAHAIGEYLPHTIGGM